VGGRGRVKGEAWVGEEEEEGEEERGKHFVAGAAGASRKRDLIDGSQDKKSERRAFCIVKSY